MLVAASQRLNAAAVAARLTTATRRFETATVTNWWQAKLASAAIAAETGSEWPALLLEKDQLEY
jgi:hypothetical protein